MNFKVLRNKKIIGAVTGIFTVVSSSAVDKRYEMFSRNMGTVAIQAAKFTYEQLQNIGLVSTKIGITPMIGKNDDLVQTFTLADSERLVDWAKKTDYVRMLSMWSINRDKSDSIKKNEEDLSRNTFLKQDKYDFTNIFKKYNSEDETRKRIFAPYVSVTMQPTPDINEFMEDTGNKYYTLAFMKSNEGVPSWRNSMPYTDKFYMDKIEKIRANGGDVIMSFGGASGSELARDISDVVELQQAYQVVIDTYKIKWIDMDIEGESVRDIESVKRRNQAIAAIQRANPELILTYCLPVSPNGLREEAIELLEDAIQKGVRVDVVNIMTMCYGRYYNINICESSYVHPYSEIIDELKETEKDRLTAGKNKLELIIQRFNNEKSNLIKDIEEYVTEELYVLLDKQANSCESEFIKKEKIENGSWYESAIEISKNSSILILSSENDNSYIKYLDIKDYKRCLKKAIIDECNNNGIIDKNDNLPVWAGILSTLLVSYVLIQAFLIDPLISLREDLQELKIDFSDLESKDKSSIKEKSEVEEVDIIDIKIEKNDFLEKLKQKKDLDKDFMINM